MNEKKIKVTDKRLFTQEGELKEEYRHLEDEESAPQMSESAASQPPAVESPPSEPSTPEESSESQPAAGPEAPPSFLELAATVAQPIALYLGDVKMPDGESMENLPMARLYIDLLEILQQKTVGNLTDQEKGFLEDLLYQLRLRYVEKSKQGSEG